MTTSEREVLELLWSEGRDLTATEIVQLSVNKSWKDSYVHLLINSLLRKDLIKIEGFVQTAKNYARTFVPTYSKEELAVKELIKDKNIEPAELPYLFDALIKLVDNRELLEDIEARIAKRKEEI